MVGYLMIIKYSDERELNYELCSKKPGTRTKIDIQEEPYESENHIIK